MGNAVDGLRWGEVGGASPGPWTVGDHSGGAAIVNAEGHRIASLAWGRGSVSMKVGSVEGAANLRLMVAAPELLRALVAVREALADWMEIADDLDQRESDDEALALADAAIVRATGRRADG